MTFFVANVIKYTPLPGLLQFMLAHLLKGLRTAACPRYPEISWMARTSRAT